MKPGSTASKILNLLAEVGPMTRIEIEKTLGSNPNDTATCLGYLRSRRTGYGGSKPRQVRISGWERDDQGGSSRLYPRPVYALGSNPDAPKPPPVTQHDRNVKRWAASRLAERTVARVANSVFSYADAHAP